MPDQYRYQAVSSQGKVQRGVITALDAEHVEEFLSEQSLLPIGIERINARRSFSLFGFFKGPLYENLIMFTNSLSTLHRAGVPLLRALSILKIGPEKGRFNYIIEQMRMSVQSGKSLSEAMAEFDDVFSSVYVASVSAGEESGQLEDTLDELSSMLEKEMEITRQVKTAMRYPTIVVAVISLAFLVLMTYVIPKFVDFFSSFGAELPLPTRIMIGISDFVLHYWPILAGLSAAVVFGFRQLTRRPAGRLWVDRQVLRMPVLGEIIAKGNIARFAIMFTILFRAGIPLIRSLDILAGVVKNTMIGSEIQLLGELSRRGQDIASIAKQFVFFPPLALNMMAIGMESGSLGKMTEEIGNHYSKEVLYRSRQLTSVLEPILTIVLGAFILIMALAIFLPMWNLIKVFQG